MLALPRLHRAALDETLPRRSRCGPTTCRSTCSRPTSRTGSASWPDAGPTCFPTPTRRPTSTRDRAALRAAGYRHYEISNFALPGRQARHNTRYWLGQTVLAVGVAAHGQAGRRRWANLEPLPAWLEAVEAAGPRAPGAGALPPTRPPARRRWSGCASRAARRSL